MLEPIDFVALYMQQAEAQEQGTIAGTPAPPDRTPFSVRAELVEASSFSFEPDESKNGSFDRLRTNGSRG